MKGGGPMQDRDMTMRDMHFSVGGVPCRLIRVNPELTGYPLWIGTREQIENDVRYVYAATQAESETKNILFYKTAYGSPNDIVESFLVNAETGEIIERNSAFVF